MIQHESSNPEVNTYLQELQTPLKGTLLKVRRLILDVDPGITEAIKWRNSLVFMFDKNMIQTVIGKKHITFIFFDGVELQDPDGLLEGEGKKNLSVRLDSMDFDQAAFQNLVQQAVEYRR